MGDRLLESARGLLPDWEVDVRRREVGGAVVQATHPACPGPLSIQLDPDSLASQSEAIAKWVAREPAFEIAAAAPPIVHGELVRGLRATAMGFRWRNVEMEALALLLHQLDLVTTEEARWLGGYVTEDAPMAPSDRV